jgi:lipopolysaccharide assembly protein B
VALWSPRTRTGPASATTSLRTALHHALAGDLAAAEVVLADAARIDSSSTDLYLALASVYRARGEVGRAIQIHQNVLLRPELSDEIRHEALLGLALDFQTGGFLRRAIGSFREFLQLEPRNLHALTALERIHVDAGEWLDAIAIRRRIGSADARSPTILAHLWTGLMRAQWDAGQESKAQRSFRRAVAADRRCAEPYVAMGELRLAQSKPRKAIHLWCRALDLHPRIGVTLYPRLHAAYVLDDQLEGFRELMARRRLANPDDRELTLWWARAQIQLGVVEPALQTLRTLLHEAPSYYPAYAEMGRALLRAGRDVESAKAFEELLEHLPVAASPLCCRVCGTRDSILHWRCPQCGEWDSFD